jgi:hypothetical protein
MDPTGTKFRQYYNDGVELIPEFFSADSFRKVCAQSVKIVTTISMFYDLESPVAFAQEVESVLSDDGVWHSEQSYMPAMLRNNAYDTICHEHLEYYSLSVIKHIVEAANMRIIDVSMNDVNGGSFAVTCAKKTSAHIANDVLINWLLAQENELALNAKKPYLEFAVRAETHKRAFVGLLKELKNAGKTVYGYGASTKGNVILQYCGITTDLITAIAEVNPDKFGSFTPGTNIPIISEASAKEQKPNYMVVFPWHFRNGILAKEKEFINDGGRFIFPLPFIEIV